MRRFARWASVAMFVISLLVFLVAGTMWASSFNATEAFRFQRGGMRWQAYLHRGNIHLSNWPQLQWEADEYRRAVTHYNAAQSAGWREYWRLSGAASDVAQELASERMIDGKTSEATERKYREAKEAIGRHVAGMAPPPPPKYSAPVRREFPIYPLLIVSALWPARFVYVLSRRDVRRVKGRCLSCGYDLRASPDRCPECGLERPAMKDASLARPG